VENLIRVGVADSGEQARIGKGALEGVSDNAPLQRFDVYRQVGELGHSRILPVSHN
jgi:hypothetical protein